MSTLLELLLLAIAAAFYPTLIAVVVIVLQRPHPGRLLAFFLAGAALASISIGLVAVFALDTSSLNTNRNGVSGGVDLVAGALALIVGAVLYRQPKPKVEQAAPEPKESRPSFSQRALARDSVWILFVLGIVLDLPGIWYLIALKDIALGGYDAVEKVVLVVGFNLIMFAFVEVPLVAFLLAPDRAAQLVESFNAWLRRNGRRLLAYIALALGTYLVVRGLVAVF